MARSWLNSTRSSILFAALLAALLSVVPQTAWARFEPVTCKNPFTQQQEIEEGGKVALKVYRQMPVLPENDPVSRYVQQLGARLVSFAPLTPGLDRQWPFNFHVVASAEINAFALPGGSVFINLGSIQAAQSEAQLAGVMAHEIAHVILRHSTCNMVQQEHRGLLYSLGAIGSSIFLGGGALGSLAQAGIGMGQNLDSMHMSRGDERQADLLGVNILSRADIDPRGLPQFFEIIRAKVGNGGAQFLSDHPNPGNRTQYVDAEIRTLPERDAQTVINTPEFRRVHALAESEPALSAQQVAAGGWKQGGFYASGPGGNGGRADSPQPPNAQQPASPQTQTRQAEAPQPAQVAAALPPASPAQLGLADRFLVYQAPRWSIVAPASWVRAAAQPVAEAGASTSPASVILAPPGASGGFGVAYGVMIAVAQVSGNGVHDQAQLASVTAQIIRNLLAAQPGLRQASDLSGLKVDGQPALAVALAGLSPVARNGVRGAEPGGEPDGEPGAEQDWMVTVARPDGDVNTLIFVAPRTQFDQLKPTFDRMLQSFRAQ